MNTSPRGWHWSKRAVVAMVVAVAASLLPMTQAPAIGLGMCTQAAVDSKLPWVSGTVDTKVTAAQVNTATKAVRQVRSRVECSHELRLQWVRSFEYHKRWTKQVADAARASAGTTLSAATSRLNTMLTQVARARTVGELRAAQRPATSVEKYAVYRFNFVHVAIQFTHTMSGLDASSQANLAEELATLPRNKRAEGKAIIADYTKAAAWFYKQSWQVPFTSAKKIKLGAQTKAEHRANEAVDEALTTRLNTILAARHKAYQRAVWRMADCHPS